MLYWTLIFLLVALVAAAFGFTGVAKGSPGVAGVLFTVFLVLFAISLVVGLVQGRPVP
jgi:uncharacterized membrane protein YtjA (UPF0391 family)